MDKISGFEYMNVVSWSTIPIPAIQYIYNNKKLNRRQLLSSAAGMLINKVSDDACQWNGHDVVISICGIFFIERFVCCMMKKSWAFSDLVAAISAALHEKFVCSKYANSVSQFLLYWMRIICCIYSYFEKFCWIKCTRQPRKVLWVVLSPLFFKEIWKNGRRGHGHMSASARGKEQK